MKTLLWSSLGRICKRWNLAELSQVRFLRTPSSLSETRYSDGMAKFSPHCSTTGFVLQASLYDSIICNIQGNLCSSGADVFWACYPRLLLPLVGFVLFVWGSLCNSSPGVVCVCAGGLCGLCTCELDVLFQWQAVPQGCATQHSNSLDVAPRIWRHG